MTNNEMHWWFAFRCICPLASEMDDIIIQATSGVNVDWFSPLKDSEYLDDAAKDLKEKNRLVREQIKKDLENVTVNRRNNTES